MPTSEKSGPEALRGIADPLERAKQSQAWITRGRAAIGEAQQVRDAAIREAHRSSGTIDEIAEHIGAKRNVVVHALRSRSS